VSVDLRPSKRRNVEHSADGGDVTNVALVTVDALSVGLSLQALARHPKTPHGTREIYERVGKAMATAARLEMHQRVAIRKERAADVVENLKAMGGAR